MHHPRPFPVSSASGHSPRLRTDLFTDLFTNLFTNLLIALFVAVLGASALSAGVPAFVLRRQGATLRVERLDLQPGTPLTLQAGVDVVSVVVPVGEGQSADLVRLQDGVVVTLDTEGGRLKVKVSRGGSEREVLDRPLAELAKWRVRVHATAWDGIRGRWRIDRWDTVTPEAGPVVNLFAGRIPLGEGDYVLTTQVEALQEGPMTTTGRAALAWKMGHPTVQARVGNRTVTAVVDLAAAVTLVRPEFLPDGAKPEPATMTEQSAAGRRTLALQGEGAGGAVEGFGVVTLPTLKMGDLELGGSSVLVPTGLPAHSGMPEAILGLDLLRPFGKVRFERDGTGQWSLVVGPAGPRPAPPAATLPLVQAGALLGVEAVAQGQRVFLVLDSGSPRTFLPPAAARAAGLALSAAAGPPPRGLDGRPLAVQEARLPRLALGAASFGPMPVQVADLPVLAKFEGGLPVGLLGSDVLLQCTALEVDFRAMRLSLWR